MKHITLNVEPIISEQLLKILKDNNISYNKYAEMYFQHPDFFSGITPGCHNLTIASLYEIGLKEGATLNEISNQSAKSNLQPCPPSMGVYLRLAWKDQEISRNSILSGTHNAPDMAVTVLSEILNPDDTFPKGLYLRNVDGNLWLRGYICDSEYQFPSDAMFAFEEGSL